MIGTETKLSVGDALDHLNDLLNSKYRQTAIKKIEVFYYPYKDIYFRPFVMGDWEAIGVEYAHGEYDAELYRYEDGDLFYLEDYESEEKLFKAILKEIES